MQPWVAPLFRWRGIRTWRRLCKTFWDFWKFCVRIDAGCIHLVLGEIFGFRESRSLKVGAPEVGALKVGVLEVGPLEVGPLEVGPLEVGPLEVPPLELGLLE